MTRALATHDAAVRLSSCSLPLASALAASVSACHPSPPVTVEPPAEKVAAPAVPSPPWVPKGPRLGATRRESPSVLIKDARLLTGDGRDIPRGYVLMRDGAIVATGAGDAVDVPEGTTVVDARGKVVTPGLIDTHSHMGVYASPGVRAHADGNEMTDPITAGVRAIDAVWVQDPSLERALAGGVTTIQVLPGSGNLIGGRAVTLKLRHRTDAGSMRFVGAPDGLKMACGENPKRVYGERKRMPMSRMGNLEVQRQAFRDAKRLMAEWAEWRAKERERLEKLAIERRKFAAEEADRKAKTDRCDAGRIAPRTCRKWKAKWAAEPLVPPSDIGSLPPKADLDLETLAGALEGHILVHIHCYRADDMSRMIALADEMGFRVRSFHHALEAYKIRQSLALRQISVSTWADWWGFKMEAYDGIQENLALVSQSGGRAIVHSDSAEGVRRLNQEAAKGMWAGRHAGIDITSAEATRWITLNPAWALGVEDRVGSLMAGKDADIVVWDRDPFSVYASAERVYVDGRLSFDRSATAAPWSDFEAAPDEPPPPPTPKKEAL